MTEDEAAKKWCPMSMKGSQTGPFNRDRTSDTSATFPTACTCLGSRCMKWLWADHKRKSGFCGIGTPPTLYD